MGLESTFWTWLRTGLKKLENLDIQRIESKIGSGVPDVEGCWNGKTFWVELKACDRPKRATSQLEFKISQGQIIWLKRRWRCGGNAFLLLRVGCNRDAKIYLIKGCDARHMGRCSEKIVQQFSVISDNAGPYVILCALTEGRMI